MTNMVRQRVGMDCFMCSAAMAAGLDWKTAWKRLPINVKAALCTSGARIDHANIIMEAFGFTRCRVNPTDPKPQGEPGSYLNFEVSDDLLSTGEWKFLLWGRKALIQITNRSWNYRRHWTHQNDGFHVVFWDGKQVYDPNGTISADRLETIEPGLIWLFDETNAPIADLPKPEPKHLYEPPNFLTNWSEKEKNVVKTEKIIDHNSGKQDKWRIRKPAVTRKN